jgi:Autoinducer binding domain
MGVRSLLERASAFAPECERMATMDELARGVARWSRRSDTRTSRVAASADPARRKLFTSPSGTQGGVNSICAEAFCASIRCRCGLCVAERRSARPNCVRSCRQAHAIFNESKRFGISGGYIVPQRAADNTLGAVAFIGASDPASHEDRFALRALAGVVFDRAEALCGRAEPLRSSPAARTHHPRARVPGAPHRRAIDRPDRRGDEGQ